LQPPKHEQTLYPLQYEGPQTLVPSMVVQTPLLQSPLELHSQSPQLLGGLVPLYRMSVLQIEVPPQSEFLRQVALSASASCHQQAAMAPGSVQHSSVALDIGNSFSSTTESGSAAVRGTAGATGETSGTGISGVFSAQPSVKMSAAEYHNRHESIAAVLNDNRQ
jgi:hypothetical protein